jgi:carbohydrate-binding DOMON domain-containing protein
MPDGGDFTAADLSQYTLPATVVEAYTASNGGAVVKLKTAGYGPDMIIMCGVDANGVVTGAVCLSSNETLGVEKTYGDTLKGATIDTIDGIATVSGATIVSVVSVSNTISLSFDTTPYTPNSIIAATIKIQQKVNKMSFLFITSSPFLFISIL